MNRVISTELNKNNKINKEIEKLEIGLYEMIIHGEPYELILEKSQKLDILLAESFNEMNSITIDMKGIQK